MKGGKINGVEWKDIEGYEGQYQVSNYGDIKRLERDIVDSLGRKKHYTEKISIHIKQIMVIQEYLLDKKEI